MNTTGTAVEALLTGRPRIRPIHNITIPELAPLHLMRFWSRVEKGDSSECWPWTGATCGPGYGRLKIGGRVYSAHRIAYEIANGPIPLVPGYHGALIMHSCDNPRCCNPHHLIRGTSRTNAQDMAAKGRNFCPNGRPTPASDGRAV